MAVYVTSDLHGFSIEEFKRLLASVGFGEDDWLYILGDVIDRNNDGGVSILLWLLEQPNVQLIRGNHEQMMLSCAFLFDEISDETLARLPANAVESLTRWYSNGAQPTVASMKELLLVSPELVTDILDYLRETPLCESVEAGGRSFLLCHAGFGNFSADKKLSDYSENELLWNRPSLEDRYFDGVITVFGHTPTGYLAGRRGKAVRTETWIDVDVGVSSGTPPMLLRLDDLREIYFDA